MGTRIGVKICGLAFRISTLQQEFAANVLITLTTIINIWQGVIKKTGENFGRATETAKQISSSGNKLARGTA